MKSKDLYFEYIEDFADYIVEKVECDEELFVSVVGKFEEIKNIIKEIFVIAEVDFESINIESSIINNYKDEYVLDCWCDDGIIQIGCESAKRDGKYFNLAGDETYLLEDCSSKIIPLCEGSNLYFVNIEDKCGCDDECCGCCDCSCCEDSVLVEYSTDNNGDIHGFVASKSGKDGYYSVAHYTDDKLIIDDVSSMLKKYGF